MKDRLIINKSDGRLYQVVDLISKLAKQSGDYYKLYKKNNSLFFYDFHVGILYEAENDILDGTILDCENGEYKLFKGIKAGYLLVKQNDYVDNLDSRILGKAVNAEWLCYVSKKDNFMIHEIMQSAMISDDNLELITLFDDSVLKRSDDGKNFLIKNFYEQHYPYLKTTTYIVLGLEWRPDA